MRDRTENPYKQPPVIVAILASVSAMFGDWPPQKRPARKYHYKKNTSPDLQQEAIRLAEEKRARKAAKRKGGENYDGEKL